MAVVRADDHWLWVGGPVPPGAAAITIGSVVSVRRRSTGNAALLAHEAEHVRQWRQLGLVGFSTWYLRDYLGGRLTGWPHWSAYRRISLEVEAEWRSRRPDLPVVRLRRGGADWPRLRSPMANPVDVDGDLGWHGPR